MIFHGICASFLLAGLLTAAEPLPLPTNQVSVEMAAPPLEGTVSIGVFDSYNRLVRILTRNTQSDKIPSALNGFLLTWDGRNDEGKPVFKGEYEIRGITVGSVQVEGVAYHLNDWVDSEKAANPPIRTQSIKLLPDGGFIAVQQLADEELAINSYLADGKVKWTHPLATPITGFAIDASKAWLVSNGELTALSLDTGAVENPPQGSLNLTRLAITKDGLFALANNLLVAIDPANNSVSTVAKLPLDAKLLSARDNLLLVSDGKNIFQLVGDTFQKLTIDLPDTILDLDVATDTNFWVVSLENSLTEFSIQGEALRNLEPGDQEIFRSVSASADDNSIALVSKKGVGNITRILERTSAPTNAVSIWKTKLQKERQPVGDFGLDLKTHQPIAKGTLPPNGDITVSLVENPLSPGGPRTIKLKSASFEDGVWIFSAEGLPLFPVLAATSSQRHLLFRGSKSREVTLFAATSGAVAEFALRGLENIMQFGGDKVLWPPPARQKADEENVPEKAPAPTPEI